MKNSKNLCLSLARKFANAAVWAAPRNGAVPCSPPIQSGVSAALRHRTPKPRGRMRGALARGSVLECGGAAQRRHRFGSAPGVRYNPLITGNIEKWREALRIDTRPLDSTLV